MDAASGEPYDRGHGRHLAGGDRFEQRLDRGELRFAALDVIHEQGGVEPDDHPFKASDATADELPGVSVSVTAEGAAVGYLTGADVVAGAQSTSATGLGFIANLAPGLHELVFTAPDRTCTPQWGWAGTAPSSVAAHVFAEALTFVEMKCQ